MAYRLPDQPHPPSLKSASKSLRVSPIGELLSLRVSPRWKGNPQIALAWVLRNPADVIVGATRQQHLADAAAALDVTLSDDDVHALEEHYTPRQPTGY